MMNTKLNWIKSGGGPLICVERDIALQWQGVTGTGILGESKNFYKNDYERACSIRDYLGKIKMGEREALILGDMPLETLIWRTRDQCLSIVRVFYADADTDIKELLGSSGDFDFTNPVESISFFSSTHELIVFDSAYAGKDIGNVHLDFELSPGAYSILTKQFEPNDRTSVLIHRFESITPSEL
jgi:hypothetical protein